MFKSFIIQCHQSFLAIAWIVDTSTVFGQVVVTLCSCLKLFQTFPTNMSPTFTRYMIATLILLDPCLTLWTRFDPHFL